MRSAVHLRSIGIRAAAALLAVAAVPAAAAPPGEVVYRCRDARGHIQMGQSIPAECMERDVDVIDASGRVVRTIPGRRAQEAVAAQQAAEEAAKVAAQRDRTLLATYLSVADIERRPGMTRTTRPELSSTSTSRSRHFSGMAWPKWLWPRASRQR